MSVYCISHSKDVDGLVAAALVFAAKGGKYRLADYDELTDELDKVPRRTKEFILCDLGTDPSKFPALKTKLQGLSKRMKVTYIDHHYLTDGARKELLDMDVKLVHNVGESSGVLTYRTFKNSLPAQAKLLALYSAVTDYLDSSTAAKRMMDRYDRQFVLLEATLLSYAIAKKGDDRRFLEIVVRKLSELKQPHEIDGVSKLAIEQAEIMNRLSRQISQYGKTMEKLAFVETDQRATGNVAKLLLGPFDVPVAVAYKKKDKGWVEVSLRGRSDCKIHLGQTISTIAQKYGGNGGGHRLAAGCSVPRNAIMSVLTDLDSLL